TGHAAHQQPEYSRGDFVSAAAGRGRQVACLRARRIYLRAKGLAMYKLLLCLRYLRTRYIALASIISVTLGVATMIVVNSVIGGFSREMQGRIHGILSDISVESHGAEGFNDPAAHMARIEKVAGEYIAGMTPSLSIPAMLSCQVQGNWHQRQVTFIGIDPKTYGSVGDFNQYLQHPANRQALE